MAKVQFTAAVNQIVGRVAGAIFQRNPKGSFVKSFKKPRSSSVQQSLNIRNRFVLACRAWAALSSSDRNTWLTYAYQYPAYDAFGNPIVLNPFQAFMSESLYKQYCGLSIPSISLGFASISGGGSSVSDCDVSATTCTLTWSKVLGAFDFLVISVTMPSRSGNTLSGLQYRFLKYYTFPSTSPGNLFSDLNTLFGARLKAGYSFKVKLHYLQSTPYGLSAVEEFIVAIVP